MLPIYQDDELMGTAVTFSQLYSLVLLKTNERLYNTKHRDNKIIHLSFRKRRFSHVQLVLANVLHESDLFL